MAAIITSKFRVENALNFKASVADTGNSYYIFLGKSDVWSDVITDNTDTTAPTPGDYIVDENDAWQNMSAAKRLTASDVISIIPRHNWTSGTSYVPWDDADEDIFTKSFYMITDEYKIYKCIKAGSGASTVKPTQTAVDPQAEGDGYVWKYMSFVGLSEQKFLTNAYIPIKTIETEPVTPGDDLTRWNIQQNSTANNGKIYRVAVTNGGVGYDSTPTVSIKGNGSGATATAVVTGGVVTAVNITAQGSGYSVAYVEFSGGTPETTAVARAILSPQNGHGTDPIQELGGFFAGLAIRLTGSEGGGDFIIDNSFRQIGLVKNPKVYGGSSVATATTLSALSEIHFSSHTGFTVGDYITGGTSGAVAFIDAYDSATGYLKYHQNDKTGYTAFQASETVTGHTGGSGVIPSSGGLVNPEVQKFTGTITFLENRAPINRSASQIEDIKIVIEF